MKYNLKTLMPNAYLTKGIVVMKLWLETMNVMLSIILLNVDMMEGTAQLFNLKRKTLLAQRSVDMWISPLLGILVQKKKHQSNGKLMAIVQISLDFWHSILGKSGNPSSTTDPSTKSGVPPAENPKSGSAATATESKGEIGTWTSSTEVCPWEDEWVLQFLNLKY